jgi:hypothetical protein
MRYESDFISAVKARQNEIAQALVAGNCVNFESYQRLVGQNLGLKEALDILNKLLEEPDENE